MLRFSISLSLILTLYITHAQRYWNPIVTLMKHRHIHSNVSSSSLKMLKKKKSQLRHFAAEEQISTYILSMYIVTICSEPRREREWEREMEGIGVGEWTWCQRQINAQRINIDLSFWWKTNLKLLLLTYRWEKFKKNVWKTWKLRLINPFINLRIWVGVILFSVNLLFDFISFFLFLNLSLISIIINRIGEWKEKKMKWKNTRTESNYNFEYSTYLISLDYLFASVFLENWIYTEQEEWSIDEFWYTVEIRLHAHLNEEYIDFVVINM